VRRILAFSLLLALPASAAPDLARARALDREGAQAYAEERYEDAIRAFEEAHRLGGPSFELWNIAKCHLRLERFDRAAEMLERYLATPGLPKRDRAEAEKQLYTIKKRPSALTVTSRTPGTAVVIDGDLVEGGTPVHTTLAPGTHTITVGTARPWTVTVDARWGAPVSVDASPWEAKPDAPAEILAAPPEERRIGLEAGVGLSLPRHGSVGSAPGPIFLLSGSYRLFTQERVSLAVGGFLALAGDSWENRTGTPNEAPGCGPLADAQSATAIGLYGTGSATYTLTPRVKVTGLGGFGVSGYAVDDVGGDLFVPSCQASPGARPALLLASRVDFFVTSFVRVTLHPFTWQAQPAFDGTRDAPRDANGVWMRFGLALGAGVDL